MKVLILGLGSIARKHIRALRSLAPDVVLHALRSSESSPAAEGVEDLHRWEEAEQNRYDFALLASPTAFHRQGLEKLIQLGCPLFIEKPLADALSVLPVVRELEAKGTLTYVGCNLRFLESIRFVRDLLRRERPRINEVNVYCGSYLPEWREGQDFRRGYSARPEMGGGVHLDLIHELDYLYWIFGAPGSVRRTLSSRSGLKIKSVDYANYCLGYPEFHAQVVLNYYRRDARRTFEIVTDERTLTVDLSANRVTDSDGAVLFDSPQTVADTYAAQMNYFLGLVAKGRKRSMNPVREAYKVLEICLGHDPER